MMMPISDYPGLRVKEYKYLNDKGVKPSKYAKARKIRAIAKKKKKK